MERSSGDPAIDETSSNRSHDGAGKFHSLSFGPRLLKSFHQPKKRNEIKSVTYNERTKRLIIVDSRGFSSWSVNSNYHLLKREHSFPKYRFNVIIAILYCQNIDVYMGLGKDYTLWLYNKNFVETERTTMEACKLVTHLLFNPQLDEVITGGDCVRFWRYQKLMDDPYVKGYGLTLRKEFPMPEGYCCTRIVLDEARQLVYCFSDFTLLCYNMEGCLVNQFDCSLHSMVLACVFSPYARMLLIAFVDMEIHGMGESGYLLHVFKGHNRAVTSLLLHPETPSIFISGSLDLTIRLWCLDTYAQLYSINCDEGVLGLGLTEGGLLYAWFLRSVHLYHLNHFLDFWSHLRYPALSLSLCKAPGKTTRLLTLGEGSSLHIFSSESGKRLCLVPPHPFLSPLKVLPNFTYGRSSGVIALLLSPSEIWVYTARTDPACRVAVWDFNEIQRKGSKGRRSGQGEGLPLLDTENSASGHCCCVGFLSSPVCYESEEGLVCADTTNFILCGMKSGNILFMDVVIRNMKYLELNVHKDPVIWLSHDVERGQLLDMVVQFSCKLVQVWSLPCLELLHQVAVPSHTTVFTRMNSSLFLGFPTGQVRVVSVLSESGGEVAAQPNTQEDICEDPSAFKHDHQDAVLSVDSCSAQQIFLSCGADALIKLWDEQRCLLSEVLLDDTVSAACFLNPLGDLLVGFRSHLFKLSHTRLLPKAATAQSPGAEPPGSVQVSDSFIYEHPCLTRESKRSRIEMEPVNMENYIEPYKGFDFTSLFTPPSLEGDTSNEKELDDGMEREIQGASSLTYMSQASPVRCESDVSLEVPHLSPGESTTDLSLLLEPDSSPNDPTIKAQPPKARPVLSHPSSRPGTAVPKHPEEASRSAAAEAYIKAMHIGFQMTAQLIKGFTPNLGGRGPPDHSDRRGSRTTKQKRGFTANQVKRGSTANLDKRVPTTKYQKAKPSPLAKQPPGLGSTQLASPAPKTQPRLDSDMSKMAEEVMRKRCAAEEAQAVREEGDRAGGRDGVDTARVQRKPRGGVTVAPGASQSVEKPRRVCEEWAWQEEWDGPEEGSKAEDGGAGGRGGRDGSKAGAPTGGKGSRAHHSSGVMKVSDVRRYDWPPSPRTDGRAISTVNDDTEQSKLRRFSSPLQEFTEDTKTWIEKELVRRDRAQTLRMKRTQQVLQRKGALEKERLEKSAKQSHHSCCQGTKYSLLTLLCGEGKVGPSLQPPTRPDGLGELPVPRLVTTPCSRTPSAHHKAPTPCQVWGTEEDAEGDHPYRLPVCHLSRETTRSWEPCPKPLSLREPWEQHLKMDVAAGMLMVWRFHSGASIPSKGPYILVKCLPHIPKLLGSPLEERLLKMRFPRHNQAPSVPAKLNLGRQSLGQSQPALRAPSNPALLPEYCQALRVNSDSPKRTSLSNI